MEGESVYRLVPPPVEAPTKPPLYRSKHPGAVSPGTVPCSALGAKTVRAAATMGPGSGELLVDPGRFLLAHEKEPVLPQREPGRGGGTARGLSLRARREPRCPPAGVLAWKTLGTQARPTQRGALPRPAPQPARRPPRSCASRTRCPSAASGR